MERCKIGGGARHGALGRLMQLALALRLELAALPMILLLAAGVRLAWIALAPVPPESDFASFYRMARLIAAGNWPSRSYGWINRGPGYPLFLALVVGLPGDSLAT